MFYKYLYFKIKQIGREVAFLLKEIIVLKSIVKERNSASTIVKNHTSKNSYSNISAVPKSKLKRISNISENK